MVENDDDLFEDEDEFDEEATRLMTGEDDEEEESFDSEAYYMQELSGIRKQLWLFSLTTIISYAIIFIGGYFDSTYMWIGLLTLSAPFFIGPLFGLMVGGVGAMFSAPESYKVIRNKDGSTREEYDAGGSMGNIFMVAIVFVGAIIIKFILSIIATPLKVITLFFAYQHTKFKWKVKHRSFVTGGGLPFLLSIFAFLFCVSVNLLVLPFMYDKSPSDYNETETAAIVAACEDIMQNDDLYYFVKSSTYGCTLIFDYTAMTDTYVVTVKEYDGLDSSISFGEYTYSDGVWDKTPNQVDGIKQFFITETFVGFDYMNDNMGKIKIYQREYTASSGTTYYYLSINLDNTITGIIEGDYTIFLLTNANYDYTADGVSFLKLNQDTNLEESGEVDLKSIYFLTDDGYCELYTSEKIA